MTGGIRTFGTILMYGGFGVAIIGVLVFISSMGGSLDEADDGMLGFGAAAVGMACFMGGMFLSDVGKTSSDFKKERKAGKTTCYSCGTKRRLEQSCPKCGAPPSSSV
jgi:hypothetical protein